MLTSTEMTRLPTMIPTDADSTAAKPSTTATVDGGKELSTVAVQSSTTVDSGNELSTPEVQSSTTVNGGNELSTPEVQSSTMAATRAFSTGLSHVN